MSDAGGDRDAWVARPEPGTRHANGAGDERSEACRCLRQFSLAVAGDSCNTENLACAHHEGDVPERLAAAVSDGREPVELEHDLADRPVALVDAAQHRRLGRP